MDGIMAHLGSRAGEASESPMDEAAFERFHAQTAQALWAYLRRLLGDPTLADDALQESYLRFLRHPPRASRDQREQRGYLFQIATNLARDGWRTRERERSLVERFLSLWPARSERSGGALSLDMGSALQRLPQRERALLWLAYVEGYDHREIAGIFNLKEGSVRVLLFRARRKLEKELA
ncbi:MAG TPA: RNA polymerase sigma factor [Thermoanaerobaculia bacterium]|jgi:RNA polymerase sigma-70 factor (ECF subfamily)|nr:RNA polymerase sigma factor [Thermoanaerobaculia bacterium]